MEYSKLMLSNDKYITYRKLPGTNGSIIYFCGFGSCMLNGIKSQLLYHFCKENDISLVQFDYLGHGQSSGALSDYVISDWCNNSYKVLEELTSGKQIMIGSSIGACVMLNAALKYPDKATAVIALGPVPDFTETIAQNFNDKHQSELKEEDISKIPTGLSEGLNYIITDRLIEDGKSNFLMDKDVIEIDCPIRLLHGMSDNIIPYSASFELMNKFRSDDVQILLVKDARHNMTDKSSMRGFLRTVSEFVHSIQPSKQLLNKCLNLLKTRKHI